MEDKRLALLPLNKETLERPPLKVIELLLGLLSRVEELERRSYETFEHCLSGSKPVVLFADAREACRSVNSAHTHTLSLSLSLLNSTYLLLRKQSWQPSARAAFCRFPVVVLGSKLTWHRVCNAL